LSGNAIYNFKLKITTLIYNNLLTKNQRNVLVQRAEPHPSQSPSIFAKVRYLLPVLAYFGPSFEEGHDDTGPLLAHQPIRAG
jgi:hypothetical protein